MDQEAVRQPTGPPTRKKFLIPLDEDEVPPAGVGRGDGGAAGRLRGVVGRKGDRNGPVRPQRGFGKCWGVSHLGKIAPCPVQVSIPLSVKCHG